MTRIDRLARGGALALCLTGCSAIVGGEVDGLRPDLNAKRDVTVSLRDFGPHEGQLVDIQFVEDFTLLEVPPMRSPFVAARAVVDPVPSDCLDVRLRRGVPFLAQRVDFYADLNMNRMRDTPAEGDHSWREPLDEDGRLLFIHDVQFEDLTIDPGELTLNPLTLNITGATANEGALATVMLVAEDLVDPIEGIRRPSVRAVYVTRVSDGTIAFTMEGVADPGSEYDVRVRLGDEGTTECVAADQRAPAAAGEALTVEGVVSALDCGPREPPDCDGLDDRCDAGEDAACEALHFECAFVDCAR